MKHESISFSCAVWGGGTKHHTQRLYLRSAPAFGPCKASMGLLEKKGLAPALILSTRKGPWNHDPSTQPPLLKTLKTLVLSHKGKQRSGSLARTWNSLIAASRLAGEWEMTELPAQGSNKITHYCRHGFEAPASQDGVAYLHPIITS